MSIWACNVQYFYTSQWEAVRGCRATVERSPFHPPEHPLQIGSHRNTSWACVFAMFTVSILLDWRLYKGAGLLWRESFRQHPLPPILKVVRLCSASKVLVAFFIFWGSRGRVRTTPTLNFGGRARVLLKWFRQPTKQWAFIVFLHTGAKILGFKNLCSVPYST